MKNKYVKLTLVVGVIIKVKDKYLLVQERKKAYYGQWGWPTGRVEEGSTVKDHAIKEVRQETGFKVKLTKEIGVFIGKKLKHAGVLFKGQIIGGKLRYPKKEIMDAKWFSEKEIIKIKNKLRSRWVLEGINIIKKNAK
ncbi:MAG: NUDIX domain-containing protein [Patescibacteria group bacterium]